MRSCIQLETTRKKKKKHFGGVVNALRMKMFYNSLQGIITSYIIMFVIKKTWEYTYILVFFFSQQDFLTLKINSQITIHSPSLSKVFPGFPETECELEKHISLIFTCAYMFQYLNPLTLVSCSATHLCASGYRSERVELLRAWHAGRSRDGWVEKETDEEMVTLQSKNVTSYTAQRASFFIDVHNQEGIRRSEKTCSGSAQKWHHVFFRAAGIFPC